MSTFRTTLLFLVLVLALVTGVYFTIAPHAVSAPQAPQAFVKEDLYVAANAPAAHIAEAPAAARSIYISEQRLHRLLDNAYEWHQTTRVQTLLRILNGRYERRVGLPW